MRTLLAALACATVLAGCGRQSATAPAAPPPAPVNVSDSNQVRAIVRDYIVNDPTLLQEALDALADRRANARRAEIESDPRDVSIGPADAPITIVEFFDYRCPYCHAAAEWAFNVIRARRDVRFVFKEFPVLGPESLEASRAAIASIPQGRYREFHRALMAHRGDLNSEAIDAIARRSGIDVSRMRRDMPNPEIDRIIETNQSLAAESDVRGTPAFLINGEWVMGFDRAALDRALARATAATQASR